LPLVRDPDRRRLRALGPGRTRPAGRHRLELLPGVRALLLRERVGDRDADGGGRAGGDRRARRLVVGEGLARGQPPARARRRGGSGRDRGRRARRAVPRPHAGDRPRGRPYLRPLGVTTLYVYRAFDSPPADWAPVNDELHAQGFTTFAQTGLVGQAAAGRFSGFYTYDILTYGGGKLARL